MTSGVEGIRKASLSWCFLTIRTPFLLTSLRPPAIPSPSPRSRTAFSTEGNTLEPPQPGERSLGVSTLHRSSGFQEEHLLSGTHGGASTWPAFLLDTESSSCGFLLAVFACLPSTSLLRPRRSLVADRPRFGIFGSRSAIQCGIHEG